ncbi:V-type ATP synthase subunit I [bacterium]|nr:V-type ATP synthase subunit I [bacterium]
MATVQMQKIQLVASTAHRQRLLDTLQALGVMELTEVSREGEENSKPQMKVEATHSSELAIANIEFVLKLIKPFAKQRNLIEGPITMSIEDVRNKVEEFDFEPIVEKCRHIEEEIVALKNEYTALENTQAELEPWQSLSMPLNHIGRTNRTITVIGTIQKTGFEILKEDFTKLSNLINVEIVSETESTNYLVITYVSELESGVKEILMVNKFSEVDLPSRNHDVKTEIAEIKKRKGEIKKELGIQDEELKVIANKNEDLQIVHDFYVWERDKIYAEQMAYDTKYTFALEGFVPKKQLDKIKSKLERITSAFELTKIDLQEGEQMPVAIKNKGFMSSFEAVTNIYGLPLPSEVDPTPFLSAFFIVFFGLCLTDAGYGILLFVMSALALRFLKLPVGMKKLVKLIMIGGLATFILGTLFGGWFGMTADQAPAFLTYDKTVGGEVIKAFKWQIINPTEGNGPLIFLILAAILGFAQVLFGILIDGFWKLKNGKIWDAVLDSFLWFYFLVIMALFGLSKGGIFLADYAQTITYLVYFGVGALILTQGRKQKNIIFKFLSGVLSLYGLVGYFADVLSYSRLMALGLGTGIIGFAFNTIGGLVGNIPVVGIVFAIVVIIIGHTLNIAISTLGAFIHSSRLQFVEFFGKFMEGGGKDFKPLQKKCKYILITEK